MPKVSLVYEMINWNKGWQVCNRRWHWSYHRKLVIVFLLYIDNVVLVAITFKDSQMLMSRLEKFRKYSKLRTTLEQTLCLIRLKNNNRPCSVYNNQSFETIANFNYFECEVPTYHGWNECATHHWEVRMRAYYAFGNTCNHWEINCWVLINTHFSLGVCLCLSSQP